MKREERRRRVLKLCDEVRKNDDALGKFSGYEGDENGPTWDAFKRGYLARRALEAIGLHRKAVALWGAALQPGPAQNQRKTWVMT